MSKGIVVDHKELGTRYAISEHNFNPKLHERVRELKPGESIHSFQPKPIAQAVLDERKAEEDRELARTELAEARANGTPEAVPEDVTPEQVEAEIEALKEAYTLEELQGFAESEGLPKSGTKLDLATALYEAGYRMADPEPEADSDPDAQSGS